MNEEVQNPIPQQNQNNVNQNNIQPITVPLQIQPVVQQPSTTPSSTLSNVPNVQTNVSQPENNQNVPQPVQYQQPVQPKTPVNQTQTSGGYTGYNIKKIDTTQYDVNTPEGQYKSIYADSINQLVNELISNRIFQYNPNEDVALQQALEYSTKTTTSSLASRGILNSSITAERISRVAMELTAEYRKLALSEWQTQMNMISNIAELLNTMDRTQFAIWQDARDQQWKEKLQKYQEQQDAIKNAWTRVDELGYVDNKASTVLGVAVGTLSKNAREAKEAYERELDMMMQKAKVEYETEKKLAQFKSDLEKDMIKFEANYGTKTSSSSANNTVSYDRYMNILKNKKWVDYDDITRKYTVNDNDAVYNYLENEWKAGRLLDNDAASLISYFGITEPGAMDEAKKQRLEYLKQLSEI